MSEFIERKQTIATLSDMIAAYKGGTASDAEALGLVVASWAHWDGQQICEAFLAALTDANFHTLAGELAPIIAQEMES